MVENSVRSDIRESSSVDKCNGTNFKIWKMHMSLFFYPVNSFPLSIVLRRSLPSPLLPKIYYGRRINKQVIVAILATIDSFHKAEVINCRTSHAMWTQLQVYHDQHSRMSVPSRCRKNNMLAGFLRESRLRLLSSPCKNWRIPESIA